MQVTKEPTPRKLIRAESTITFREREFKGSRLRCLLAGIWLVHVGLVIAEDSC
jgi:hypothetical protein